MITSKGKLTKIKDVYVLESTHGVRYTALNKGGELVGLDQYDNEYKLTAFVRHMFKVAIEESTNKL